MLGCATGRQGLHKIGGLGIRGDGAIDSLMIVRSGVEQALESRQIFRGERSEHAGPFVRVRGVPWREALATFSKKVAP